MAIEGGLRKGLDLGTKLVAHYKGATCTATIVAGEDHKVRFRLADGREFKSPSAAGSAVMGGIACNGWRFWSVDGAESTAQPGSATTRPHCTRCGKSFVSATKLAHHAANAERLCLPA